MEPETENGALRNIAMTVAFDGTAYHGWQVQANARTVQQTLQDALEAVLRQRPPVTGCSRTDAGVHARAYVCNFRTGSRIPCPNLLRALNTVLPPDIAVQDCRGADPAFHARYSAAGKEYVYRFLDVPARSPFWQRYALHWPWPLDTDRLQAAALSFVGTHDFSAFCAAGGSVQDHVRTVSAAQVERADGLVVFRVRADGFLYHMVRIMAGTLLDVARGNIGPESIGGILRSGSREAAGFTAPAHGLCLNRVFYADSGQNDRKEAPTWAGI